MLPSCKPDPIRPNHDPITFALLIWSWNSSNAGIGVPIGKKMYGTNMSLRQKALFSFIFGSAGLLISLLLSMYVDQRFLWLAIICFIAVGTYGFILRCKNCGEFMGRKKIRIFGVELTYWGGFTIPRTCSRCGAQF